jgi:hypothetical protein
MHIITGKDKLNIKLNKYGQLMYGKKVSIYLLCLILMSISSYKPNLNCLSSDVNVMHAKKNLKNNVRFVDDITKQNHELMKRMRDSNRFDSVWFYNCGIYGRTSDDKQF